MTGFRKALAAAAAALMLTACGLSLKPDPKAFELAQTVYAELAEGQDEALEARLPAETQNPTTLRTIGVMRELLPEGEAAPAKLVGWNNQAGTGGQQASLVLMYDYPGEHILATVVFRRKDDTAEWSLFSFNIRGAQPGEVGAPVFMKGTEPPPAVKTKLWDS